MEIDIGHFDDIFLISTGGSAHKTSKCPEKMWFYYNIGPFDSQENGPF
jgi:hypothetical protein